jgi:hypothetical protein
MPRLLFLLTLLPSAAFAEVFQRPVPQPQTAAAELSYFIASILMILMLAAAGWLVKRR